MNKNSKLFLNHVIETCLANNISLVLNQDAPCLVDNEGSFNGDTVQVNMKVAKSDWNYTLAHELSHLHQKLEHSTVWNNAWVKYHGVKRRASGIYNDWIDGKRIGKKVAKKCCQKIVQLELDCEIRTIKLIKHWRLPINMTKYIQNANMVIYSYVFSLKHCYFNLIDPKSFNKLMPKKLLKNYQSYFDTYEKFDKEFLKFI